MLTVRKANAVHRMLYTLKLTCSDPSAEGRTNFLEYRLYLQEEVYRNKN